MGLTSDVTLALAAGLALAAVVLTAVAWNRSGRSPWLHWPARGAMLVTCQLTACAVVALFVNDAGQFYSSWTELFGGTGGVSVHSVRPGAYDKRLNEQIKQRHLAGHSLVTSVEIPDAGGTKAHPALVYLPAQYFDRHYAQRDFPVVEMLVGVPGTAGSWLVGMSMQQVADAEIASGRAVPFVAVLPMQNYIPHRDTECVNVVHGPRVETTLTTNVRAVLEHDFRVLTDRRGWSLMGYSTGGYCAVNIALRHPDQYGSAVSLGGYDQPYVDRTTGRLFGNSVAARNANDPLWRLRHLPPPDVSLLLGSTAHDPAPVREDRELALAARPPTQVYLLPLPHGGHTFTMFQLMEPVAFDWLSRQVVGPLAAGVTAYGLQPTLVGPSGKLPRVLTQTRSRVSRVKREVKRLLDPGIEITRLGPA